MKKIKRLVAVGLATLCVAGTMISASAAPSVASKSAGEFGTLTGSLEDSAASVVNGLLNYLFSYGTTVTKAPGATAKIYAKVSCVNNSTGAALWEEGTQGLTSENKHTGYYVQLDHFYNIRNITVGVFGSHEARYTNAYGVYTNKTYNLYRDHGIK